MNDRIKEVRNYFRLSQSDFGKRLGMSRDTVANIECNRMEIKDLHIKSICREFNVDYIWLTTGEGEMISDEFDDIYESIDRIMVGENDFHKRLFRTLVHLDEYELLALERIMDKFINEQKKDD